MEIKAFKALRYDAGVAGDVGRCVAPPYDVIDARQQQRLYEKSEYNIVRIIKTKSNPGNSSRHNQYTRAGNFLDTWIEKGVLKSDSKEAIYAYVQNFELNGTEFERSGFIALGRLEEFGAKVKPHEKTMEKPTADRLNLMRVTKAQFGQIFMLYDDYKKVADKIIKKAAKGPSLVDFMDDEAVRHRLFAINDAADIKAIQEMMADKHSVIADGHHRYEAALNYSKVGNNPSAVYRMMTFVNMRNDGLVILPTHRLVNGLNSFDIKELVNKLQNNFEVSSYPFDSDTEKAVAKRTMFEQMQERLGEGQSAFGIYGGGNVFYVAVLKDKRAMEKSAPEKSRALRSLDVSVLHTLILEKILGIGEEQLAKQQNIEYIKDTGRAVDESIARVDSGDAQVMFFVNSVKAEQVREVAVAGEKMPQKSTFFFPKVFTGLTINKIY